MRLRWQRALLLLVPNIRSRQSLLRWKNMVNFRISQWHEFHLIWDKWVGNFVFDWNRYWGSSDRTGPGTRLKWDYCVPSEIPLSPYSSPTTARPPYNKGNLPINEGENQVKNRMIVWVMVAKLKLFKTRLCKLWIELHACVFFRTNYFAFLQYG